MAVREPWNRPGSLVEILEATYRVEQPEEAWLGGVLDAARPSLEEGLGVIGFTYDASQPAAFKVRSVCARDALPQLIELFQSSAANVPAEWVEANFGKRTTVIRDMPGWESFLPLPVRLDADHVVDDAIGVNGMDPSRVSCLIGAYSSRPHQLAPRARQTWNRVGTHLAAGFRLHQALRARESLAANAEAVLSPSGRVLHAEQPAQNRTTRDSLSEACQFIERARTHKGRADGEISLSLWRSLVSERWTLVDTYERDGKRYVVARRNDVRMPLPTALSPRERQVLGFAVLGDSNKLIAYELGISASTVAVLLHRAAQKLGCHNRSELLQRFRELAAGPPTPPKPATS